MEHLEFFFQNQRKADRAKAWSIVGVVGSGNLEVLVEQVAQNGCCTITVETIAEGFAETWQAVLERFVERHPVANLRISINDGGASPAIVNLRLDQAIAQFMEGEN